MNNLPASMVGIDSLIHATGHSLPGTPPPASADVQTLRNDVREAIVEIYCDHDDKAARRVDHARELLRESAAEGSASSMHAQVGADEVEHVHVEASNRCTTACACASSDSARAIVTAQGPMARRPSRLTCCTLMLRWKLATDTFGETYHFKRLHGDTLANTFHGDVLSSRSFERNHRMVLCLKGIDDLRDKPEADWRIEDGGFPVYFLFPNVVVNVGNKRIAVVRVYADPDDPGHSISKISYYFERQVLAENPGFAQLFSEGFTRVVADEDYATAETTQRALASGLMSEVIFGRNEPPLHHYHNTFRKALGLEPVPFRP